MPRKMKPVRIEWGNLRHDETLDKLLEPHQPIGSEFARNAEKALFTFMHKLKIWKVYIWDDFNSEGSTARWDWCFDYKRPENKACREHNFANLVAMDDWHFERFVRSLPPSPNEGLVREWRNDMRKDQLVIQAAKAETPPMNWSDCEFDPNLLYKKELL